jgi:hypothetical protein
VNTKPGIGTLTVNASRDIGTPNVDVKPPSDDFLNVVSETNQLGSLFRNTQGDCPNPGAGRDTVPGADCGPNYETDSGFKGDNPNAPKGAQDALSISQATFRALAADKTIQLTLTGTDGTGRAGVGRLKVWNVNLRYAEVPEPSTLALSAFALAGLTIARRRRQKPREDASSPYN